MPEHDLLPTCVHCSRTYRETKTDGLPSSVPVERSLVMRAEQGRGDYQAIVHYHGEIEIVPLGPDTPSDAKVRSTPVFAA